MKASDFLSLVNFSFSANQDFASDSRFCDFLQKPSLHLKIFHKAKKNPIKYKLVIIFLFSCSEKMIGYCLVSSFEASKFRTKDY